VIRVLDDSRYDFALEAAADVRIGGLAEVEIRARLRAVADAEPSGSRLLSPVTGDRVTG
jgi:hypothetical protein